MLIGIIEAREMNKDVERSEKIIAKRGRRGKGKGATFEDRTFCTD
jgi:hypothetical protein